MIEYRNMEQEDIHQGLALCRSAGWNQLAQDWKMFLQYAQNSSRVATIEDQVVGTVTTINYAHRFSWIGMVLVDPSFQRKGIGKGLLTEALNILKDEETVKLDATPDGREVYLKLQFQDEYRLSRMIATAPEQTNTLFRARAMQTSDLPVVVDMDTEAFGAPRDRLLRWMFEASPQMAFVVEVEGRIEGYALGRPGHNFFQIGPVIAKDRELAKQLVMAALAYCAGKRVVIDAMHHDMEWLSWLGSMGFSEQRPFIRMYRGVNRFRGIPGKQFAIAGPEFG